MCIEAGRTALEAAGLTGRDLDAIVLGTITPDQPLPSTALVVKEALGADRAIPLDLNQVACAAGVYSILLGAHLLQNDQFRHILVVGADAFSRLTDPDDRTTRVFFGDAAGAAVLGVTEPGYGLLSWDVGSALSYGVEVPAGGARRPASAETVAARQHYLKMDGREVWRMATKHLAGSIAEVARRAGVAPGEIDHFFLHQANRNILTEVLQQLQVPAERAAVTVDWLGNTGAASVYTVLHELGRDRPVKRGDLFVISAIGAGYLWGSLCVRQS
jgi:3-oxoacyl-[acyl-carrier-protein] synthase-3